MRDEGSRAGAGVEEQLSRRQRVDSPEGASLCAVVEPDGGCVCGTGCADPTAAGHAETVGIHRRTSSRRSSRSPWSGRFVAHGIELACCSARPVILSGNCQGCLDWNVSPSIVRSTHVAITAVPNAGLSGVPRRHRSCHILLTASDPQRTLWTKFGFETSTAEFPLLLFVMTAVLDDSLECGTLGLRFWRAVSIFSLWIQWQKPTSHRNQTGLESTQLQLCDDVIGLPVDTQKQDALGGADRRGCASPGARSSSEMCGIPNQEWEDNLQR